MATGVCRGSRRWRKTCGKVSRYIFRSFNILPKPKEKINQLLHCARTLFEHLIKCQQAEQLKHLPVAITIQYYVSRGVQGQCYCRALISRRTWLFDVASCSVLQSCMYSRCSNYVQAKKQPCITSMWRIFFRTTAVTGTYDFFSNHISYIILFSSNTGILSRWVWKFPFLWTSYSSRWCCLAALIPVVYIDIAQVRDLWYTI